MPHTCKHCNGVCMDCIAEQVWDRKEDKTYYSREVIPLNTIGSYDDTYSTNFLTRQEEASLRSRFQQEVARPFKKYL